MTQRVLKFVGIGLLSLAITASWPALPAAAQVDDGLGVTPVLQDDDDDDFEWGLLGLLGLLGLAGLMRRDRHRVDYRDTATTTTATRP